MKFLPNWLSTKFKPTSLQLLDMAYIVVLLPLLMVVKVPMLIFISVVIILLIKEKKPTTLTLISVALLGALALFLSLYGSFNFAGISRLKLFIELLIYLLFVAIALQRVTEVINIYLKLSPLFLLALSLFFFHSIPMLFYIIIEIFILIVLILWQIMQSDIYRVFRMASLLFISALPWVILLFIFFPRISFEHANYGFKGESIKRTGHDGKMHLDNTALLVPSDRIVMEVGFKGAIPSANSLYFRGSVLYKERQNHWEPLLRQKNDMPKPQYDKIEQLIAYKITLYPTNKRWLYLLDMPFEAPKGATINGDFETTLVKNIVEIQRYTATSNLGQQRRKVLDKVTMNVALSYDETANKTSQGIADEIMQKFATPSQRLTAVEDLFKKQALTYTLKPKPLDLNNSTDSFLFDTKSGYCVHFAAAFTTMSRMCQIPSRIVTGYKSDGAESIKSYLVVKEKDAHAWVEVYMDSKWQRIESTAFATYIDREGEEFGVMNASETTWSRLNLNLLYVKYQIETWILEYSHFRQMRLFDNLKNDMKFLVKFLLIFLLLIVAVVVGWRVLRREKCEDELLCLLNPVLKRLESLGYYRNTDESLHTFLMRIDMEDKADTLKSINQHYHQLRYAPHPTDEMVQRFRELVKVFLG